MIRKFLNPSGPITPEPTFPDWYYKGQDPAEIFRIEDNQEWLALRGVKKDPFKQNVWRYPAGTKVGKTADGKYFAIIDNRAFPLGESNSFKELDELDEYRRTHQPGIADEVTVVGKVNPNKPVVPTINDIVLEQMQEYLANTAPNSNLDVHNRLNLESGLLEAALAYKRKQDTNWSAADLFGINKGAEVAGKALDYINKAIAYKEVYNNPALRNLTPEQKYRAYEDVQKGIGTGMSVISPSQWLGGAKNAVHNGEWIWPWDERNRGLDPNNPGVNLGFDIATIPLVTKGLVKGGAKAYLSAKNLYSRIKGDTAPEISLTNNVDLSNYKTTGDLMTLEHRVTPEYDVSWLDDPEILEANDEFAADRPYPLDDPSLSSSERAHILREEQQYPVRPPLMNELLDDLENPFGIPIEDTPVSTQTANGRIFTGDEYFDGIINDRSLTTNQMRQRLNQAGYTDEYIDRTVSQADMHDIALRNPGDVEGFLEEATNAGFDDLEIGEAIEREYPELFEPEGIPEVTPEARAARRAQMALEPEIITASDELPSPPEEINNVIDSDANTPANQLWRQYFSPEQVERIERGSTQFPNDPESFANALRDNGILRNTRNEIVRSYFPNFLEPEIRIGGPTEELSAEALARHSLANILDDSETPLDFINRAREAGYLSFDITQGLNSRFPDYTPEPITYTLIGEYKIPNKGSDIMQHYSESRLKLHGLSLDPEARAVYQFLQEKGLNSYNRPSITYDEYKALLQVHPNATEILAKEGIRVTGENVPEIYTYDQLKNNMKEFRLSKETSIGHSGSSFYELPFTDGSSGNSRPIDMFERQYVPTEQVLSMTAEMRARGDIGPELLNGRGLIFSMPHGISDFGSSSWPHAGGSIMEQMVKHPNLKIRYNGERKGLNGFGDRYAEIDEQGNIVRKGRARQYARLNPFKDKLDQNSSYWWNNKFDLIKNSDGTYDIIEYELDPSGDRMLDSSGRPIKKLVVTQYRKLTPLEIIEKQKLALDVFRRFYRDNPQLLDRISFDPNLPPEVLEKLQKDKLSVFDPELGTFGEITSPVLDIYYKKGGKFNKRNNKVKFRII